MPALYSYKPINFSDTINGSTAANLYAGITAVLTGAGWTGTTITGGFEYVIESPQELSDLSHLRAKVRIWVETVGWSDGTAPTVAVQLAGYHAGSDAGMVHWLRSGGTWMCWANCCSFAIARMGVGRQYPDPIEGFQIGGNSVIGGILFTERENAGCGLDQDLPPLYDVWFSSGDIRHDVIHPDYQESFRNSVKSFSGSSSSSVNGVAFLPGDADAMDAGYREYPVPAILAWVPGQITGFIWKNARMRWWNSSATVANPIYYPPLVGWGTAANFYPVVQGTFYDGLMVSVGQNIDVTLTLTDDAEVAPRTWYNYTFDVDTPRNGHNVDLPNATGSIRNFHGSLLLLTETVPLPATEGNCAY